MRELYLLFSLALLLFSCGSQGNKNPSESIRSWLCQLQDISPEEIARTGFDLVVIDYSRDGSQDGEFSKEEIESIKRTGKKVLAYLSIGEAEDYRFYWNEDWYSNPPPWLGEKNPEWAGNYAVKYWYPEWHEIIKSYIDRIVSEGFDGLYLDKVDEFYYWAQKGELPEEDLALKMVEFIEEIADYCRLKLKDCLIVPQNGEELLKYYPDRLNKTVNGWSCESLFYNGLEPVSKEETDYRLSLLRKLKGKLLLSIDYVYDGNDIELVKDYYAKAEKNGFIPYAASVDRELDRIIEIPGIQPKR